GLRLARHLDESIEVRAGSGVLETVVENILDNAIGFTPPGGGITVSLSRRQDGIELQIDDEGPGVDAAEVDRIFDRYYSMRSERTANADAPEDGGAKHAGLGLWIVRRNVEALGGSVRAYNRTGGGLSVRIVLPASL